MILDAFTLMSSAQAPTSSSASTDYIDTVAAGDSYEGAWFYFKVDTAATASGAATVTVALETDDNDSFSSAKTLVSSGAVAKATLVAGYEYKVRIPAGAERYIRAYYTIATGPLLTGAFTAAIALDTAS